MRAIRVSLKTARVALRLLEDIPFPRPDEVEATRQLRAGMAPKRSAAPARKRRTQKKATQRQEWAAIREAVLKRAGGVCECGCGVQPFAGETLECDHFFGGNGRRQALQSKFTVWALERGDHHDKSRNFPSPAYWLERFIAHAAQWSVEAMQAGFEDDAQGYMAAAEEARKRLGALELQARATP